MRITCASKWIARGRSNTSSPRSTTHVDSPAAPARFAATAPTGPQPTISRSCTRTDGPTLDAEAAVERVGLAEHPSEQLRAVQADELPVRRGRLADNAPVEDHVTV